MKKLIAFFAFLCLAVGTTGAKGFLENPGKIDTRKLEYTIPYIPVEQRATILPKHNICSIAPAEESSDYFIRQRSACSSLRAVTTPISLSILPNVEVSEKFNLHPSVKYFAFLP